MHTLVEKIAGDITRIERKDFISTKPYLFKKEACFNDFINQEEIEKTKLEDINKIKLNITYYIFCLTKGTNEPLKLFEVLYNMLKNVSNEKEFDDFIKYIEVSYGVFLTHNRNDYELSVCKNNDFNYFYTNHKDVVCSIITKKIVTAYYEYLLKKLYNREISKLYYIIATKGNFNEILSYLKIEFNDISKKNGIELFSKKVLYDLICKSYDDRKHHLCGECQFATNCTCPKVKNRKKRDINDYPFINSGFQVFDKSGNMKRFIVSDCMCYEKAIPKPITYQESLQIARAKESILLDYFDAENVNEARMIQETIKNKNIKKTKKYNCVQNPR